MSYAAIYVVGSLQSPLPWTEAAVDMSLAAQHNRSASEHFWAHVVLNKFDRLEGLGPVQPMVAGARPLHGACTHGAPSRSSAACGAQHEMPSEVRSRRLPPRPRVRASGHHAP